MLELVDYALKSATEAGKKTSKEADDAFTNAASKLSDYGRAYHPSVTVAERIEMAEKTDKSSSKLLNRMMETFRVRDLITLLYNILTLIFRHRRKDAYRKSSFLYTSPFQIVIPLL